MAVGGLVARYAITITVIICMKKLLNSDLLSLSVMPVQKVASRKVFWQFLHANFSMFICNHTVFLIQFGINLLL